MIVALLFVFILLQIADCITTVYILKQGGREANPFMNWLFGKVGIVTTLVVMKLIAIGLVTAVWNEWLTFVLIVVYVGVVSWNSYQIWKD